MNFDKEKNMIFLTSKDYIYMTRLVSGLEDIFKEKLTNVKDGTYSRKVTGEGLEKDLEENKKFICSIQKLEHVLRQNVAFAHASGEIYAYSYPIAQTLCNMLCDLCKEYFYRFSLDDTDDKYIVKLYKIYLLFHGIVGNSINSEARSSELYKNIIINLLDGDIVSNRIESVEEKRIRVTFHRDGKYIRDSLDRAIDYIPYPIGYYIMIFPSGESIKFENELEGAKFSDFIFGINTFSKNILLSEKYDQYLDSLKNLKAIESLVDIIGVRALADMMISVCKSVVYMDKDGNQLMKSGIYMERC